MRAGGPDRAVILAGGGGTRLWPWTGPDLPKPLLPLGGGGRTLLRATLDRLRRLLPDGRIDVQAAPAIAGLLAAAEPAVAGRLRPEPSARDTGPAVALAMRRVLLEDPAAVVSILPADHRVADEAAFAAVLDGAAALARDGALVLLGIRPSGPDSRFGYIVPAGDAGAAVPARTVDRFVEKPAREAATALIEGGALWNGGIFTWRADVFWEGLERHAPELAAAVADHVAGEAGAWERATRTSIDYALVEKVRSGGGWLVAVPLEAGWDDVGGWDAVLRLVEAGDAGPAARLAVRGTADEGSVVLEIGPVGASAGRHAVLLGPSAQLVVLGPHGVLVAPRGSADEVKRFA